MLGGGTSATRLTLAFLAISAGAIGATGTDCCEADDGDACCPNPSILDKANDYGHSSSQRVVFASERCCPDGSGVVGCSAYEAAGCCFCRDVCDDADESCVLCSVATSTTTTVVADAVVDPVAVSPVPDGYITGEWYPPYDPEATDGLWDLFGTEEWNSDIEAMMSPGSYDFYEESGEYDCSSCAWGDLSALKQRKLTERSRSMVCDSTCLTWDGDEEYGVTLCNYFNEGKECRACCHVRENEFYHELDHSIELLDCFEFLVEFVAHRRLLPLRAVRRVCILLKVNTTRHQVHHLRAR